MNQNEIQQTDYQENWENNELDIEYWEEEYSSQSDNECQFTMCFYCNEEIEVDYLPYHQCLETPNYWDETNSLLDYENEECGSIHSNEEENNSIVDILDSGKFEDEFLDLEDYYYDNLQNDDNQLNNNLSTNNTNHNTNHNPNHNPEYNIITSNNYDNLDSLDRNCINFPIPVYEIPDVLRGRVGLPDNNYTLGLHSALDKDIIYKDNYQKWCNIIVLDVSEECNVCLHKKNKFHQFKICHHRICEDCCFKWFDKNNTCPICRSDITKLHDVIPVLTSGYRKICV